MLINNFAHLEARKILEMLRHVAKLGHRSKGSWNGSIGGLNKTSPQKRLCIEVPQHLRNLHRTIQDDETYDGAGSSAADDLENSDDSSEMHDYPGS